MLTLLILLIHWYLEGEITMPWTRRCRATVHSLPFPHSEWKLNGCWIKITPLGCKTALNEHGLWISTCFICSNMLHGNTTLECQPDLWYLLPAWVGACRCDGFTPMGSSDLPHYSLVPPLQKNRRRKYDEKKTQGLRWREYLPVTRMGKTNSTYGD